jgi:hypothetical protein
VPYVPWVLALAAVFVIALPFATLEADDPVGTSVTFNREIIRIVQRKCESCHARDGLAMSLSEFRDLRAWSRAIREELVEQRMPPAIVARGYGRYQTDPSLNAREMATFLAWLDGGMPRGDEADRPPRVATNGEGAGHQHGADARLSLPPQTIPADEELVVRRVTVDAGAAAGRGIARVQLQPGNRRVLRGALVFVKDQWIGGWLPWQHAVVPPATHAFQVPAGASLTVELYYRGGDAEQTDQSAIDISFAPENATGRLEDVIVQATDDEGTIRRGRTTLARPATVWALYPTLESVQSLELRAERPDKSVEVLLWIPRARPEWPLAVVMQEPVTLPAGTIVSLVAETIRGPQPFDKLRVAPSIVEGQGSAPHLPSTWGPASAGSVPRVTIGVASSPAR